MDESKTEQSRICICFDASSWC